MVARERNPTAPDDMAHAWSGGSCHLPLTTHHPPGWVEILFIAVAEFSRVGILLDMMKKLFTLMAGLLLAASVFAGDFQDITISDLKQAIASKKVTVIDVNGSDSYKKGHVPGALDFDKVEKDLARHLPADKDALVVAYCGGPTCGAYAAAAKAAKALGYTNVKHLSAGISGWKQAKEKLEKGS